MFSTASPDRRAYGCEECLALAPAFGPQACSSYPQIQEAIAVKRLYDILSSDVTFGNSLLKLKLVILVFKKIMPQQVLFVSHYRRNKEGNFHCYNPPTARRDVGRVAQAV